MNEYRTTDLAVACFLATKGYALKSVERDPESTYEKPRGIFVFTDQNEECKRLALDYRYSGSTKENLVDAKHHFEKIREIKNILHYNLGFIKK